MCTNYVAPGEDPGLSELKIDNFRDLYRWTPWKPEIYQDYDAPIVGYVDGQFKPLIANFGFWPRALQKANVEKAKEQGRKPPIMRSTMNVRDDNLGKSPLYGPAWRVGRRCLIPAKWIYEPNWETGKHIRYRIGLAGWRPLCVAGIWRTLQRPDGTEQHTMAMITVNGDEHPIMKHMHRLGDEKRSVVILRPEDWEEWLTTSNVDAARAMLQLYPAGEMFAEPSSSLARN
ncbi:SOS response-associated peptidase family protein [Burkholderia cepacia]|uniref:SOS response-associated peptidase family protein n=1 Tax=Burkholderia cepacia complex TaxID=87882 RepID=UPI00158EE7FF|nr:SOS response-associated peptidase family protein [Burkholderia cenocepacia]EKS9840562.1 SOS response-associated peptidase family protein [Burkholderia cepacia]